MPPGTEDKVTTNGLGAGPADAAPTAPGEASASKTTAAPTAPGGTALAVREDPAGEPTEPAEGDLRLERLPMQVDVMVKVRSFRVQDLLAMQKGTVVETVQEHTQDVPVRCGGALLLWSEFEVLDQRLAVRVTRLA